MKIKLRKGLQEIRTRSGLAAEAENPQRRYLRVASLELKRTLCERVRDAARKRVAEMDRKIAELEAEKAELLAAGGVSEAGEASATPALPLSGDEGSAGRHGLALKY